MKRLLFLTGQPGVGKTSVLLRVVNALKAKGYDVRGMISGEIREQGTRVGFEITDLYTGQKGWLAHIKQPSGPQVGKYRVNLDDLKNIGVNSILDAIKNADVIIVDEIGPMELHSEKFREAVIRVVEGGKLVVGTVHWKARDNLIEAIRAREDAEIYKVTYDNRGNLHEIIVEKAIEFLKKA